MNRQPDLAIDEILDSSHKLKRDLKSCLKNKCIERSYNYGEEVSEKLSFTRGCNS